MLWGFFLSPGAALKAETKLIDVEHEQTQLIIVVESTCLESKSVCTAFIRLCRRVADESSSFKAEGLRAMTDDTMFHNLEVRRKKRK